MTVDFSPDRWAAVKETYEAWWAGTLDRALVPVVLTGVDPGRPCPKAPVLSQATCADRAIPAEDLIDRLDYELSQCKFLGDAFPYVNLDSFGPGVAAAFLGARLDNSSSRVWFHPEEVRPISQLHFEYDPDNIWLNRILDICRAAMDRWQGQVLVGTPDLGGVLDILSTFRPSEMLLYDLYDHPEEVKRLTWELHELWFQFLAEDRIILRRRGKGSFIAHPKLNRNITNLYSFTDDMKGLGLTPHSKVLQSTVLAAGQEIARLLGIQAQSAVFRLTRLRMADQEPLLLEETHIPLYLCPEINGFDFSTISLYAILQSRYGLKLAGAKETYEAVKLDKDTAKLLHRPNASPAFRIQRTGYLEDGTVFELTNSLARSDKCIFAVEMRSDKSQARFNRKIHP